MMTEPNPISGLWKLFFISPYLQIPKIRQERQNSICVWLNNFIFHKSDFVVKKCSNLNPNF